MSVVYIALPLALLLVTIAVTAFVVQAGKGQFDDLDTPPLRMLYDDVDELPAPNLSATTRVKENESVDR